MKIKVSKCSDWDYESEVEIETLEELFEFIKKCGYSIVIEKDCEQIIIYDGYLE